MTNRKDVLSLKKYNISTALLFVSNSYEEPEAKFYYLLYTKKNNM